MPSHDQPRAGSGSSDAEAAPAPGSPLIERHEALALRALAALPRNNVTVYDRDLRVVFSAGQPLTADGEAPEGAHGRRLEEMVPPETFARFEPACRAALHGETSDLELCARSGARSYEMRAAPLRDAGDQVVGGMLLSRDITAQRRAEQALTRSEAQHRELAADSLDVVSRSDHAGIYSYVSDAALRVYGWTPEQLIGRHVADFLHPDDTDEHAGLRRAFDAGEDEVVVELRKRRSDDTYVWMESRCRALRGPDGGLAGVQTAAREITDRKAAESARYVVDEQFRTAFDEAPIGIALVAPDGRCLRANDAVCEILGRTREVLIGNTIQDITHPDDLEADLSLLQDVLEGRRTSYQMEKRYLRPDGGIVPALLSVSLVRDPAGVPLHFISHVQDISARKRLEERLQVLATRDPLTDVLNRRAFEERLAEQVRRHDRYGEAAALLMLDLDRFKDVNDRFGHQAGDQVLIHTADGLRRRLRTTDVIGRQGGDEFAILLPKTPLATAHRVALDLTATLAGRPLELGDTLLAIQASVGVAAIEEDTDVPSLLAAADRAMYAAKNAGRAVRLAPSR